MAKQTWNGVVPTPETAFTGTLFTATQGDNVKRITSLPDAVYVRKVATPAQALACGAVMFISGADWIILPADVVQKLNLLTEGMCKILPCAELHGTPHGHGSRAALFRVTPSYLFQASGAATVTYAGVPTRSKSCIGWSGLNTSFVGYPISNIPLAFGLPRSDSAVIYELANPGSTSTSLYQSLANNPMKNVAWFAEVAYLKPKVGVLDLFKSAAVQQKLADDLDDLTEYFPAATAAALIGEKNYAYPIPLLHIRNSSGLCYIGPGLPEKECAKMYAPKAGDTIKGYHWRSSGSGTALMEGHIFFDTGGNSKYWWNELPAFPAASDSADGTTDAKVTRTRAGDYAGHVTGRVISGMQVGAPAISRQYDPDAVTYEGWTSCRVVPGGGTQGVTSVNEVAWQQAFRLTGAVIANPMPWLPAMEVGEAIMPISLDEMATGVGFGWKNAQSGAAIAGQSAFAFAHCAAMRQNISAAHGLSNRLPPTTIGGVPAQRIIGGCFFAEYYDAAFALRDPGGGDYDILADLNQIPRIAASSYTRVPTDTTGMDTTAANNAAAADDTAYASWTPPKTSGYEVSLASERWTVTQHEALGKFVDKWYDKLEEIVKDEN